ncbi:sugar ABC transporter permease [Alsobacter sp. SYSU M60028]|uniref:Sugar ABC transporter permease n=1 Tax=Alsobacter ponti TaxID=2962936 RepID=A0ABT1L7I1_9HYPH|nr:sugar ABC transporter permease [Alsobacter ponti]MCP8937414.1 sugar ABC transporter permease [Alsobacter ponti]
MQSTAQTIPLPSSRRRIPRPRLPRVNGFFFFILPGVSFVLSLTLFPALYGIYISLTNLNLGYVGYSFVGLENYGRLLEWDDLGLVTRNTLGFVASVVVLQVAIGLLVSILLNQKLVGHQVMRSLTILPWVLPSVVVGLVFAQIFGGSRLGIANYVLSLFGVGQMSWLADPALAMALLVAVSVWRGVPFTVIILLGGLQTLPRELYEAAVIDGATAWQRFRYVTLPLLKPILMISLIMGTGGALNSLDIPLALTGGGPGSATELFSISLYKQSFFHLDISYGAAIGTVMLVVNLVLIVLYLLVLQPRRSANHD